MRGHNIWMDHLNHSTERSRRTIMTSVWVPWLEQLSPLSCSLFWDSYRTVVVIKLLRTSALWIPANHPILHVESWLAVPGTAAAGLKFLKFILIYLYSSRATQPWRKLTLGPAYAVWLFTQTGKGTQGETMSINHNEGSSPTTLSQSTLAQLVKAGPANDTYYRLPARLPR